MRDLIVHEYFAVNLEVVGSTIHEDFPRVRPKLHAVQEELPNGSVEDA